MRGSGEWRVPVALIGVAGLLFGAPVIWAIEGARMDFGELTASWTEAIGAVAAALVSLAALWALFWTFSETRKQNRAQSRAYVSATPVHLTVDADMRGNFPAVIDIGFRVVAKNYGQTPANDAEVWANIIYDKWPMPPRFWESYKEELGQRVVIRPTEERRFSFKKNVLFDEQGLWETPPKRIILTGILRYRDVYGERRYVRFTGSITNMREWWLKARHGDVVDLNFEYDQDGNDAD